MWCVHILNWSPAAAIKEMTPEEAWSGNTPKVDHFRLFGCIAHAHIPKEKHKKLDDKSIKCVLFGLIEESKAYRLYDLEGDKIIISRDVVFEEDAEWDWKEKSGEDKMLSWNDSEDEEEKGPESGEENENGSGE